MKKVMMALLVLMTVAAFTACAVEDGDNMATPPSDDGTGYMAFSGSYDEKTVIVQDSAYLSFPTFLEMEETNATIQPSVKPRPFTVMLGADQLVLNKSLPELLFGVGGGVGQTVMSCLPKGYSADGSLFLYSLKVPDIAWSTRDSEGHSQAWQMTFSSESEMAYNAYLDELTIWLVSDDYRVDGMRRNASVTFVLKAKRV